MATGNFQKCHDVTAKWEGGWSNHKADPGGKTMYGVTEAVYHKWLKMQGKAKKPVRYITRIEASAIYRNEFWHKSGSETLAPGVDLATYDASVNSGVSRGRKWLLDSIGQHSDAQTVKNICAKRLGFMQSLKIWRSFGKGWSRRVADIEAKGVAWAMQAVANQNVAKKTVLRESEDASKKAAKLASGGAVTGGGGAVATPEAADQMAAGSLVAFLVIVAIVAGVFIWRAKINKQRAEAYRREAAKL